jgi:hypothetical protein
MNAAALAQSLIALYNKGGPYTAKQLSAVYSNNITFTDPAHSITGLTALCDYLNHQYGNVQHCEFILQDEWITGDNLFLQWDMSLRHPKLKSGQLIIVNGFSNLLLNAEPDDNVKVIQHRDYFDLGQLLYENVPVIGAINRLLKKGLTT